MYDAFFLTYDEPNGNENYEYNKKLCPNLKRVHGVEGIFNAHMRCSSLSRTSRFWVIDGDTRLNSDIILNDLQPEKNYSTHIWYSKNPINDLEYGYGGIKLFHKRCFKKNINYIDMTTSINQFGLKVIEKTISTTYFNTNPLITYRSAFRECAKLSSGLIKNHVKEETEYRLSIWCSTGENRRYGRICLEGARDGREFGFKNINYPENLNIINDYNKIKTLFEFKSKNKKFKDLLKDE